MDITIEMSGIIVNTILRVRNLGLKKNIYITSRKIVYYIKNAPFMINSVFYFTVFHKGSILN